MEPIDLNDYVAGGYFVAKRITRSEWMSSDLLPEQIISLSNCLSKTVEVFWGWDIEQYRDQILDIGISEDKLSDFKAWSASTAVGFPNVFYSLNAAQDFIPKFIPDTKDFSVVGLGLQRDRVAKFLYENITDNPSHNVETKNNEIFGTNFMLSQYKSLVPDGNILGFEMMTYWWTLLEHSWLCHHLEPDIFNTFGIRPNQYGLIGSYDDAMKIDKWLGEDENRGAPEPYDPWLIVQYPIL